MLRLRLLAIVLLGLAVATPGFAQGVNGVLEGKVTDEQGLALPGVNVTVRHSATGFQRSATSDTTGVFRVPGLPIGKYEVKTTMSGFAAQTLKSLDINVASTTTVDFRLAVAGKTEEVVVTAEAPLIDVKDSGVGEIVTSTQIENLPLNGRQFGNLAALVPGVSLGFHTDPTKSTQFAPQAGGGGGRNINYLIDGGDNNDDTVGGLVQNFPLDSIGEFNFQTQRFKAEYGRANGGTLTVVTKSGTNDLRGSAFNYFRDKSLNSQTETEKLHEVEKGAYRKYQYGGSLGGPIVRDKTHFFLSFERVQQDTTQSVDTLGLFPEKDGVYDLPYRENMFVGKVTHQLTPNNYLSVRYGFNNNSQIYGASPQSAPESWGDNKNSFHSANLNLNSVLSGGKLNELMFQYSFFSNHITEMSTLPSETFPSGVYVGQSVNTPQSTDQQKYQLRDDFTWNQGRHELKAGVSFINEPVLDITFSTGQQPSYVHLEDSRNSPISSITYNGSIGGGEGGNIGKIPNKQYGLYLQDTWRATDKLTFDLGVRYDYVSGFAFDQEENPVFADLQAAGRAGKLDGVIGLEDFGQEPAEDKNNVAPRAGFTFDANGNGSLVVRGGAGRYYDFAYTNANILFAVISAQSSFGQIYSHDNTAGIKNPDGSNYQVGQPLPPNQLTPTRPHFNHGASPRIKQPYTDQANLGFSKSLGKSYAIEFDAIYAEGKDLGVRPRLNVRINGGPRRFSTILPNVGSSNFAADVSEGRSHYKAISLAFKKRWDGKLQFLASYTLSKSTATSRRATDEFIGDTLVNAFDPFADVQEGPTNNDARHRINLSGVWSPGFGLTVAPVFRYRSKTPYTITTGNDDNKDGVNFDLPAGTETVNQARGSDFSQLDLRVSKKFSLTGRVKLDLIAEAFNVLNAKNPGGYNGNMRSSTFGQPTEYAGDFQRGEQRIGQFGLRVEF
ncbi:MAG TPA: TonB-dependent receptor [Vicinamibacteria bacterium]|nr:TonB-dependent receptor [Vicinamibacteria bacterium]